MLCHSVRSFHSPLCLSLKFSFVAMLNLVTAVPCGVYLSSGSLPRVPMRMTLFTLFAMGGGSFAFDFGSSIYQSRKRLVADQCRPVADEVMRETSDRA